MQNTSNQLLLVACDFDHTLIDTNSDLVLFNKLPYGQPLQQRFTTLRQEGFGWTQIMQTLLAELAKQEGYSKADVLACMHDVKMDPVLVSALEELRSSLGSSLKLTIFSDANTIFIDEILKANGLSEGVFDKVYTNPARWTTNDVVYVEPYQPLSSLHNCQRKCKANMCKSDILERARQELGLSDSAGDVRTIYIGDGSNDLCPSLSLSSSDLVLARDGYRLQKLIEQTKMDPEEQSEKVTAQVKTWTTQRELGELLLQLPIVL
ncbi:phosphatase phospho-type [Cadophora sp. MPI-SDFR-AT-0126]|nr:phosphatase phospho-type [Leotiomycetes sp. MPI-SDFR-AT-0126]